jgi:hypothetical protein
MEQWMQNEYTIRGKLVNEMGRFKGVVTYMRNQW